MTFAGMYLRREWAPRIVEDRIETQLFYLESGDKDTPKRKNGRKPKT